MYKAGVDFPKKEDLATVKIYVDDMLWGEQKGSLLSVAKNIRSRGCQIGYAGVILLVSNVEGSIVIKNRYGPLTQWGGYY